jgi:2-methylcitrate dehydratase
MQKIRIAESEEFTARFPNEMVTEIVLTTTGGAQQREIAAYPRGHAKNPMNDAEVDEKFFALADAVMDRGARDALHRALATVDEAANIRAVLDLVRVRA